MTQKRNIAVFTGNRSEYGLQYPILKALAADSRLEHQLIAGGAHLLEDFGRTVAEIQADGFHVHCCEAAETSGDSLADTVSAIAAGIASVGRMLAKLRPDFLVVYGDRSECFAAMIAGTQMNVPTAHIEGGDYTEGGALDDSVRHAMTKLAHLHFTTNAQAAERVRRLGEEPWRVFNVGLPALDLVAAGLYAQPEEIAESLGLDLDRPLVLFCHHSVTTECDQAAEQAQPSLRALETLAAGGVQAIITYPNNDAGGRRILEQIVALKERSLPNLIFVSSLGRRRFHGVLNVIGRVGRGAFVGNSSAGVKETPIFGCPVVNVGPRQQGRLRGNNVIDATYDYDAVLAAIRRCIGDEDFRRQCRTCDNPYGAGNAGAQIAEILATIPIDSRLLKKRMTY